MNDRSRLRERARTLLARAINLEWPTRLGAMLQPVADGLRAEVRVEAESLLREVDAVSARVRTIADLAQALVTILRALRPAGARGPLRTVFVPPAPAHLRVLADERFLRLRAAMDRAASATGAAFVLHGSLASDDWTGYRDADLLLLVPDAALAEPAALEVLRRACLPVLRALIGFDPLQHHGLFVLPHSELVVWPEEWLPVAALERAVDPCGSGHLLELCSHHDRAAARRELDWLVKRLAAATLPRDAYGWKALASLVMLLPAVFSSAIGEPCAKIDSFARVAARVSEELWEPIRIATAWRAAWRAAGNPFASWLCRNAPNPRAMALLGRRLARPGIAITRAQGVHFLRGAAQLATHLAELARESRLVTC